MSSYGKGISLWIFKILLPILLVFGIYVGVVSRDFSVGSPALTIACFTFPLIIIFWGSNVLFTKIGGPAHPKRGTAVFLVLWGTLIFGAYSLYVLQNSGCLNVNGQYHFAGKWSYCLLPDGSQKMGL